MAVFRGQGIDHLPEHSGDFIAKGVYVVEIRFTYKMLGTGDLKVGAKLAAGAIGHPEKLDIFLSGLSAVAFHDVGRDGFGCSP